MECNAVTDAPAAPFPGTSGDPLLLCCISPGDVHVVDAVGDSVVIIVLSAVVVAPVSRWDCA